MLLNLLDELERELKKIQLWSHTSPSVRALASSAPFCYDTLRFEQWLQFVLVVRLRQLIEQGQALPANANIASMAEQVMPQQTDLIDILVKIDAELN